MADTSAFKAGDLMRRIRYQVFTPMVTTVGPCVRCGQHCRGAWHCAECLGYDLDKLLGTLQGTAYVVACREARERENEVMQAAETLDGE